MIYTSALLRKWDLQITMRYTNLFKDIQVNAYHQTSCYTCTSSDPGGCPTADHTGMTACSQSQDCYIFGAPCGKGWVHQLN